CKVCLVKVPQLAARDDFFETVACRLVSEWRQRLGEILLVALTQRRQYRVIPEVTNGASDENTAFVQRVTQGRARVAENNNRAFLHHETGHIPGVATYDHRAALHGNAGPRRSIAAHHDCAPTYGCTGAIADVFLDNDRAAHDPLGQSPASGALHGDRRAITHTTAVVT